MEVGPLKAGAWVKVLEDGQHTARFRRGGGSLTDLGWRKGGLELMVGKQRKSRLVDF